MSEENQLTVAPLTSGGLIKFGETKDITTRVITFIKKVGNLLTNSQRSAQRKLVSLTLFLYLQTILFINILSRLENHSNLQWKQAPQQQYAQPIKPAVMQVPQQYALLMAIIPTPVYQPLPMRNFKESLAQIRQHINQTIQAQYQFIQSQ